MVERKAKERSQPKPRGLFDAFFPPDDASETSESSPLVEMLHEKLQLADDRMEMFKGVSVSKEAEALIVKKAKEVASTQSAMRATHHHQSPRKISSSHTHRQHKTTPFLLH